MQFHYVMTHTHICIYTIDVIIHNKIINVTAHVQMEMLTTTTNIQAGIHSLNCNYVLILSDIQTVYLWVVHNALSDNSWHSGSLDRTGLKQAVWPPGSANTVSPRPSVTLTFDHFTLKLACESHLRWGTFIPNLGTLGLWVLKLFTMYATDEQTDGQDRQKQRLLPPYIRAEHKNVYARACAFW